MVQLTNDQLGTLIDLVENGPLPDSTVENLQALDDLLNLGMAVRVIVQGEDCWTAANYMGRNTYIAQFHGDDLQEALAGREAIRVINAVSKH